MIREFFNEHIRFKRNIDRDIEDMWDLMICGHAKSAHPVSAKVKFLNFIINIIGIVLAFVGMSIFGFFDDERILILLAVMVIMPIIVNSILQAVIKITWLNILLCLVSSFVIGVILGAIGTAL